MASIADVSSLGIQRSIAIRIKRCESRFLAGCCVCRLVEAFQKL